MNVLAINCGSSSLKFRLAAGSTIVEAEQRPLAYGSVGSIGPNALLDFRIPAGAGLQRHASLTNQGDAVRAVLEWLSSPTATEQFRIDATGHRIVHGGAQFQEPTRIDPEVLQAIRDLEELAPLHNGPAVQALQAVQATLGANVPAVATFDTSFHHSMPPRASLYALPLDLMQRHAIRRYGFHGLAHRWMAERAEALLTRAPKPCRLITLQLGSGCSIAAIEGGRSVDTSMGFTPIEGLMMATRSGDIDPSLVGFLARHEGIDVDAVNLLLDTRSGLLGVSGRSADTRELLTAESQGDERSALAIDMFCYRVRKMIGAYLAALGGADAIVFGGGIGENSATIRERICAGMEWCGIRLDADRNAAAAGSEGRISADAASIAAYVIPVDEEAIIVRDTIACLATSA